MPINWLSRFEIIQWLISRVTMAKSVVSQSVCYSEGISLLVSFDAGNASKKDNESIVKQISIQMNEKWSDVKGNAAAGFSIGCDCSIENEG